jgi:hypothetical protein
MGFICRTAMPLIFASCVALGALVGFRQSPLAALQWINPFMGCVLATALTGVVFLVVLLLMPAGRRSIGSVRELLPMLRRRPKADTV